MSDGLGEVSEELANHDPAAVKGYCFYHEQDVARKDRSGGDSLATSYTQRRIKDATPSQAESRVGQQAPP